MNAFRHGEFNSTTILALVIAACFVGNLPLIAGLVARHDRGWKRAVYWAGVACWLVLVASVTRVLQLLLA